jgi:uncharacterized protein (DUF488 family)
MMGERPWTELGGLMATIYTIGHTKKDLERFIRLLQEAGVDIVVDIRLRNTSQLAGFSKRDDLAFLLREGFGIDYEHRPELAPTPEILDAYKAEGNWAAYERDFPPLLAERDAEIVGRDILARYTAPCLLCAEPTPDHCHRRLVAEYWAKHLPDVEIIHLI